MRAAMRIDGLTAEYRSDAFCIGCSQPRLSWMTYTDAGNWAQTAYEIEIDGESSGVVESRRDADFIHRGEEAARVL